MPYKLPAWLVGIRGLIAPLCVLPGIQIPPGFELQRFEWRQLDFRNGMKRGAFIWLAGV